MFFRIRSYAVLVIAVVALSSCGASQHPKVAQRSTTSSTSSTTSSSSTTTTPLSTTTTLRRLSVPNSFEPASVSFVSQSDGFVLGTSQGCASTSCASIVTTTNNGASWQQMPAPPAPFLLKTAASGASSGISQIRFANINNGWAFGPSLYVTHNSGASWQQVPISGQVTALATAGSRVFAVVTHCNGQTGACSPSSLMSSSLSSNSFSQVPGVVGSTQPNGMEGESPLALYATPNGVAGFVSMGYQGNYPGTALLYGTNGGSTWARFPDPCAGTNLQISSLAMPNATTLDTLCSGGPAAGSTQKILMSTSNSQTKRIGTAPMGGDGGQLASPSASNQLIATSSGASLIYRSTNSGQSWSTTAQYGDGGAGFVDFGFTTPTQGIAIHGMPASPGSSNPPVDSLIESTNGGASWHTVSIP